MPVPERFLSSLMVNYKGRNILIDCGESTQVSIRKYHTGFRAIDIICLTHFHGDHILGLPGLLLTIGNSNRTEPIIIIGPPGLNEIIEGLKVVIPYLPYSLDIIEMEEDKLDFTLTDKGLKLREKEDLLEEDISISTIELDHSDPCIGYSFYIPRRPEFDLDKAKSNKVPREFWKNLQMGKTVIDKDKEYTPNMVLGEDREGLKLSFITDTRPIDSIIDFIKGSKIFICEGTYGDNEDIDKAIENQHMTFKEAADLAKKSNVEKLIITHFSPAVENPKDYEMNATSVFKDTIIGYDGLTMSLSFE